MKTANLPAYSYMRFSNMDQGKGDSIRRQTANTQSICERNKWTLDSTLTDRGLSAWSGKNAKRGALATFLTGVESGKIATPCVLVVEQLDRITRQNPMDALALLTGLINAGVTIAVFRPSETIYTRETTRNPMVLMSMVMALCLAFDESEKKSERLKEAWQEKRNKLLREFQEYQKKLKEDKEARPKISVVTSRLPKWLEVKDGVIRKIPEKVQVVKRILKDSLIMGDGVIAKNLNSEKVPTLTGEGVWHGASINKNILRCRSLIGEYQPNRMREGKRIPDGPPIPNYYPAIISEAEFMAMQGGIENRKCARVPIGKTCNNLFSGLLKDVIDNSPIIIRAVGGDAKRQSWHYLAYKKNESVGNKSPRFPYPIWETAFLTFVGDLVAADIVTQNDDTKAALTRSEKIVARLASIDSRLAALKNRLATDDRIETLFDAVKELEVEKTALSAELKTLRIQTHAPAAMDLVDETKKLREQLKTLKGEELLLLRLKLRAVIRSLVRGIKVRIFENPSIGGKRGAVLLFAEIRFASAPTRTICAIHQRWRQKQSLMVYERVDEDIRTTKAMDDWTVRFCERVLTQDQKDRPMQRYRLKNKPR